MKCKKKSLTIEVIKLIQELVKLNFPSKPGLSS